MPIQPWFERSFDFSLPLDLTPPLLARLRGTPPRLEDLLNGSPHERRIRRQNDQWSAQEHAGHLLQLESLWITRIQDYLTGATQLTPADLTNRATTEGRYQERSLHQILSDFRSTRNLSLDQVRQLPPTVMGRVLVHPRLNKPMRLLDHLYFVAEHDDHHLAWIVELLGPV